MSILSPDFPPAGFLEINGVGAKKLEKYGDQFLGAIAEYRSRHAARLA